jgi:cyclohexanone monooxygenase
MSDNKQKIDLAEDIDATKARFDAERDKRLRDDATSQYAVLNEEMKIDPWMSVKERAPVKDHVTYTFLGGGWAGLIMAAELAKKGIEDIRIIDRAGDVGGVWYWNRYPGLMCDSTALVYLPLLEETGHMPTKKYAYQPEILEHAQRIAKLYKLYDHSLFHTEITEARWSDDDKVWHISTNRGDEFTSKYFGMGTGFLSTPKVPGIPGVETFKGKAFHSARWDYDFTGGSPEDDNLSGLAGKRVGIIGTGASTIQLTDAVSKSAAETFVFQRTPSAVHVRGNGPTDKEEFDSFSSTPGWQKAAHKEFVRGFAGLFAQPYIMSPVYENLKFGFDKDPFLAIASGVRNTIMSVPPAEQNPETIGAALEKLDLDAVSYVHEHTSNIVDDPETAEKLKPWYRPMCKRPTWNDYYLQSYNRPNTHLVDTDGQGVKEITENGIVANGKEYPLDCIIYASGYDFQRTSLKALNFDVIGKGGRTLNEYWQDGLRTLHGSHVNGFPNMFLVQLAQGGDFPANIPTCWTEIAERTAIVVDYMEQNGIDCVMADQAYEEAWVDLIASAEPVPDLRDCTPGLLSHEGSTDPKLAALQGYPEGARTFYALMSTWQNSGEFEGLCFEGMSS